MPSAWAKSASARRLIRALEPRLPNLKIVVSTTTTTGMEELEQRLPSHISRIYYPIDYRRCVSRALNTVRPEAIVLVEAEIWPNFIWKARDMGIPVVPGQCAVIRPVLSAV